MIPNIVIVSYIVGVPSIVYREDTKFLFIDSFRSRTLKQYMIIDIGIIL